MADPGILWLLITVLFMGQYIKEQLRKKKAVCEETELSEERAEAGCRKLYAIRITAGIFLAVGILILGYHPSEGLKVICLDVGQGTVSLWRPRRITIF